MDASDTPSAFLSRWSAELKALQESLSITSTTSIDLDRASHKASDLSRELTSWADRLPAYDLRRCDESLKKLNETLAALMTKAKPKPKFSFKSRASQASSSTLPPPSPATAELSAQPARPSQPLNSASIGPGKTARSAPPVPANALTLTSATSAYFSFPDLPRALSSTPTDAALVVTGLSKCFVDLVSSVETGSGDGVDGGDEPAAQISALYLYELKGSVVLLPPIEGSIMVHGCESCLFILGGHQFRMHDSTNSHIALHIGSTPIIERCHGLTFSDYPSFLSPKPLAPSSFASVQDFDFPFANATSPSPNWKLEGRSIDQQEWSVQSTRSASWRNLLPKH